MACVEPPQPPLAFSIDEFKVPKKVTPGAIISETHKYIRDTLDESSDEDLEVKTEIDEESNTQQVGGKRLREEIQRSFFRAGYKFMGPSGDRYCWTGSKLRLYWVRDKEVDSSCDAGSIPWLRASVHTCTCL